MAAGIMIFAACMFIAVAAVKYLPNNEVPQTLAVSLHSVSRCSESESGWIVSGRVINNSGAIHGIPDMIVIAKDTTGAHVHTQRFRAPVPVLYIDTETQFEHRVVNVPSNATRFTIGFVE